MKKTKQAEIKKGREKISFRVNVIDDRKIIDYIEKSTNGSAFIKEALNYYIRCLERGMVSSNNLQTEEERWDELIECMANINIEGITDNNDDDDNNNESNNELNDEINDEINDDNNDDNNDEGFCIGIGEMEYKENDETFNSVNVELASPSINYIDEDVVDDI